ncbi:hypothetical protein Poly30_05990 [Planctomycetes bacterium Poly30]|uniref:DUF423 domain-containing protein n=1 Tax=Saltatorellus ferox TaxID=2528018 RepID=A0A518ELY5_9BACT|nr:hypothetical protein Poly30_05990 [Planctomycetes bacterium Poly30]
MNPVSAESSPSIAPIRVAAILGFLGVGLGAFGAHGLEGYFESSSLDPAAIAERLDWWKTATFYHLVHAVALAAAGAVSLALQAPARLVTWSLAAGIAIFSGTLYAMALGGPRWLGAVTPIGGVLLMLGWVGLFRLSSPEPA